MPFRSRDFFLFSLTFAVLVIAIVAAAVDGRKTVTMSAVPSQMLAAVSGDTDYPVLANTIDINAEREARLQEMRQQVISRNPVTIKEPTITVEPELIAVDTALKQEPELCPVYATYGKEWSPLGIKNEVVEGARLIYREVAHLPSAEVGTQKEVLLQLPLRLEPTPSRYCLPQDVIGVALDGSLIRNQETRLYGVFGNDTLVGYALDGFPIYGRGPEAGDGCGGIRATDGYRYQIATGRDHIINCFSGTPISLP